ASAALIESRCIIMLPFETHLRHRGTYCRFRPTLANAWSPQAHTPTTLASRTPTRRARKSNPYAEPAALPGWPPQPQARARAEGDARRADDVLASMQCNHHLGDANE